MERSDNVANRGHAFAGLKRGYPRQAYLVAERLIPIASSPCTLHEGRQVREEGIGGGKPLRALCDLGVTALGFRYYRSERKRKRFRYAIRPAGFGRFDRLTAGDPALQFAVPQFPFAPRRAPAHARRFT